MPGWDFFGGIALFAFATSIIPGPNTMIIATAAVNFGLVKTARVIFGVNFGFAAMLLIVALGGGFIFARYPFLHDVLRWTGIVFMCWLAWKIASAGNAEKSRATKPPTFFQMATFQWINPKSWVMCGGATAAFISAEHGAVLEAVLMTATFFLVDVPCMWIWGFCGATIGKFLHANPIRVRVFNIAIAVLMLGAFIPAALME